MSDQDESLLLRWSRRKAEARRSQPPAPIEVPAKAEDVLAPVADAAGKRDEAAPDQTSEPGAVRAEDMADENLPDVETLTYESDFSAFLREGVPEQLKRRALRKLWSSNSVFANLDGLNDYDPVSMTIFEALQGAVDPVAETGRSLHDKIMEAKRAREDRKVHRRLRPGERRAVEQRTAALAEREPDAAPSSAPEAKKDDEA